MSHIIRDTDDELVQTAVTLDKNGSRYSRVLVRLYGPELKPGLRIYTPTQARKLARAIERCADLASKRSPVRPVKP